MSADNYYIIRRHPKGGFVPLMGFCPEDDQCIPEARADYHIAYPTVQAALDAIADDWTEYGTSIHPECEATVVTTSPFDQNQGELT